MALLVEIAPLILKALDDEREKGLIIGETSPSDDTYLLPLSVKNILDLDKLKIVIGYPGTCEAALALEQGELSGRMWDIEGIKASRPDGPRVVELRRGGDKWSLNSLLIDSAPQRKPGQRSIFGSLLCEPQGMVEPREKCEHCIYGRRRNAMCASEILHLPHEGLGFQHAPGFYVLQHRGFA